MNIYTWLWTHSVLNLFLLLGASRIPAHIKNLLKNVFSYIYIHKYVYFKEAHIQLRFSYVCGIWTLYLSLGWNMSLNLYNLQILLLSLCYNFSFGLLIILYFMQKISPKSICASHSSHWLTKSTLQRCKYINLSNSFVSHLACPRDLHFGFVFKRVICRGFVRFAN